MNNFAATRPESFRRLRLLHFFLCALAAVLSAGSSGCGGASSGKTEYAWVSAPEVALRDRVALVYNKTGVVANGERVQIIDRLQSKHFLKVRTSKGDEGWLQERFVVSQKIYDQLAQMGDQFRDTPTQAVAVTRTVVNLHVTPGRKTEHLFQLNENEKVELLQRQITDRNAPPPSTTSARAGKKAETKDKDKDKEPKEAKEPKDTDTDTTSAAGEPADKPAPAPVMEDWWLVRSSQKKVGWVLGRLLYVDVPIDIAVFAEGRRIVAFFLLNQVQDKDKKVPEYLTLMAENKDGLTPDFDQVRVFTWNTRKHRYETAYRQHNLEGVLPVAVGKDGEDTVFTLHLRDDSGAVREERYRFNSPMVHRIPGPGETEKPAVKRKVARGKRSQ